MKHLFFVAVASSILSIISISVEGQTNVNLEKLAHKNHPKVVVRFIEGIELTPEIVAGTVPVLASDASSVDLPGASGSAGTEGQLKTIEACSALQFKYAMLTEQEVEKVSNFQLYAFIDDWWGTRYRYGGTGRKGIDCSALTSKLFMDVYGVEIPRTAKEQFDVCEKVDAADLVEGDLVFFNTRGGVSHVGVYLGNTFFLQSSVHGGVTISSLSEDYYRKKYIGAGRYLKQSSTVSVTDKLVL